MIRPIVSEDAQAVLELVSSSGLFSPDEQGEILSRLNAYLQGKDDSIWIACEKQGLEGIAYCVQEPMTRGTWNMLMLIVREASQGHGVGKTLVRHAQNLLAAQNARMLIVETSGTDGFKSARGFYAKCGFIEVASIPNFYDDGDDKVIFLKSL